jgi:hypothetical protein
VKHAQKSRIARRILLIAWRELAGTLRVMVRKQGKNSASDSRSGSAGFISLHRFQLSEIAIQNL